MRFPDNIIVQAYHRQKGKCGDCGSRFERDAVDYKGHHLKRVADGGDNSLENCVLLCDDCHYLAHGGNYKTAIQLSPSEFPYFYG